MIRITAKKDGFRRAGISHAGTRDYPDGRFTPQELAMLKAETRFTFKSFIEAFVASSRPEQSVPDGKKKADA